jgi:aromatic-L-amino-acid decarboxylase
MTERTLLHAAADHAADWLESVDERPIPPEGTAETLRRSLPPEGAEPRAVLDELVAGAGDALLAFNSPRFFGWVVGGTLPAALAADWMASAWDQNTGLAEPTPAASLAEEVAGSWLRDLLGLPTGASFAFVTGCQMAHVTALAAARHAVLARAGWDVARDGLAGAPRIRVLVGAERHVTVDRALRLLGIGASAIEAVDVDARGAMSSEALAGALATGKPGPVIVCAQVGNVNTGAVDPLSDICGPAHDAGAWVHVDGAFGLWAAASPSRRALVAGVERADSWATDAHKWLNVPYDSGLAFVADPEVHRAAMAVTADYLPPAEGLADRRDPMSYTPEFSRRARGFAVYAALRHLGRDGVAELVDRLCDCAERFAERLAEQRGVTVLAQELNQVLLAFEDPDRLAGIQRAGLWFPTPTVWRGRSCVRISVSNYKTTVADVDRCVAAMA